MDNLERLTKHLDSVSDRLAKDQDFSAEELGALGALKESAPAEPSYSRNVDRLGSFGRVDFAAAALFGIGLAVWFGYSLLHESTGVDSGLTGSSETGSTVEPGSEPGDVDDSSRSPKRVFRRSHPSTRFSTPTKSKRNPFSTSGESTGWDRRGLTVSGDSPGRRAVGWAPGGSVIALSPIADRTARTVAALGSPNSHPRNNRWTRLNPETSCV